MKSKTYGPNTQGTLPAHVACAAKIVFQRTISLRECWRRSPCDAGVQLCSAGPDEECNLKRTDPILKEYSPRTLPAAPRSSSKGKSAHESRGRGCKAKLESSCARRGPMESKSLNAWTQHSRNTARAGCLRHQDRLLRQNPPKRDLLAGAVRRRSATVLGGS